MQDGSVVMEKAIVKGEAYINKGTIKNATLNDVVINGAFANTFKDGFYILGGDGSIIVSTPGLQNNNNVVIPSQGGTWAYSISIPFSNKYNGFRAIIMNGRFNNAFPNGTLKANAPSGKYFYENGKTSNSLVLNEYEAVEMIGYGDDNTFFGWIILRRFYTNPQHMRGRPLHASYMGIVTSSGTLSKVMRYDNATVTVSRTDAGRYKVTINPGFSAVNNYMVFATCDATGQGKTGRFAAVYDKTTNGFMVYTGDDNSPNDSGFVFMIINTTDF